MELGAAGGTVPPDAEQDMLSRTKRIGEDNNIDFDAPGALQKNLRRPLCLFAFC